MAYAAYRAYKSTSFIEQSGTGVGTGWAPHYNIGQATQCAYIYAGGGKIDTYQPTGQPIGTAEVYSRFGLKFNIDFSPMISIQYAVLSLWAWNSGTMTEEGVPTIPGTGTTLSLGRSVYDWAEASMGYAHAGYGNYKFKKVTLWHRRSSVGMEHSR